MLVSGFSAGIIHGTFNLFAVEPYLDDAIYDEVQNSLLVEGLDETLEIWIEHDAYRTWQKGGQILAGGILGIGMGSLFGIVYALSLNKMNTNPLRKAFVIAGILWLVIFFIPFLKYPSQLPGFSDPETIDTRVAQYFSLVGISGISALVLCILNSVFKKKIIFPILGYAIILAISFLLLPDAEFTIFEGPHEFRIASILGVTIFWLCVSLFLGSLWSKFDKLQQNIR